MKLKIFCGSIISYNVDDSDIVKFFLYENQQTKPFRRRFHFVIESVQTDVILFILKNYSNIYVRLRAVYERLITEFVIGRLRLSYHLLLVNLYRKTA